MRWDYGTIKATAKQTPGVTVKDLIVLAPQNDPFYVGTKGDMIMAEWFAGIWRQFGYGRGVHLRRIHYQLASQGTPKPNGKPYENTLDDWFWLGRASTRARYLGTVDAGAFVDRRNPDPLVFAEYPYVEAQGFVVTRNEWQYMELPNLPSFPGLAVRGYMGPTGYRNLQPYHLEVWCEKTTMNDILEPLCRQYGVNLITGAGELSITATVALVNRVVGARRPCRILYVSDFDPAGFCMPVSVARKIEFLAQDLDIRLEPIVLTGDQVAEYDLPRMPIKPSELRKISFEGVHGQGAVELDALEALHPGALRDIMRDAIWQYHDPEIEGKLHTARYKLQAALEEARQNATEDLQEEIDSLEGDFDSFVETFEASLGPLRERYEGLEARIRERLDRVEIDFDDHELPQGELADEDNDVLFDSTRDYLDQLAAYQEHKLGG